MAFRRVIKSINGSVRLYNDNMVPFTVYAGKRILTLAVARLLDPRLKAEIEGALRHRYTIQQALAEEAALKRNSPIQLQSGQITYAQPGDSNQAAWLAEARTQYNSAIINPGSLPISLSLPPAANGTAAKSGENAASGRVQGLVEGAVSVQEASGVSTAAAIRADQVYLLAIGLVHDRGESSDSKQYRRAGITGTTP
jgi:hypothetical protein